MEEVQLIRSHQVGKSMETERMKDERKNKRERERERERETPKELQLFQPAQNRSPSHRQNSVGNRTDRMTKYSAKGRGYKRKE